ncbi:16S rRNA (guanine(527)-N(7))-methyltransferase RsmG [Candidatus Poribacteria bacterium]|nr:MAG: 16S rRNA (guanine(527)-N(7))-methyltransferase RsmG [Candidatus Poribacteria bacterium]
MRGFRAELERAMRRAGFKLSEEQIRMFALYRDELKKWNRRVNLTSITDDRGIIHKHFIDSLLPLKLGLIEPGAKLADVGTGAGFPGLPMKICEPSIETTLIDSSHKKTAFLKYLTVMMGLSGVRVVWGRAEELAERPGFEGAFDVVTTRYVADLSDSVGYCLKLLRPGGIFIAFKGEDAEREVEEASELIAELGGEVEAVLRPEMPPGLDTGRRLVLIRRRGEG